MKLRMPSTKRALVDKANSTVLALVAVSAVVVTFCLVASKALWDQSRFQSRVADKKTEALVRLQANATASQTLVNSYQAFVQQTQNVIGGNPNGDGERDGDNARIVLDALPSKYDFPALLTSIEKILNDEGFSIESISGTDQQIEQSNVTSVNPIEMPFEFSVNTSYDGSHKLFDKLQKSIRPFQVLNFSIRSASEQSVTVDVSAKTYYQPEKGLDITMETVR